MASLWPIELVPGFEVRHTARRARPNFENQRAVGRVLIKRLAD
jgi:hypothetical protein